MNVLLRRYSYRIRKWHKLDITCFEDRYQTCILMSNGNRISYWRIE